MSTSEVFQSIYAEGLWDDDAGGEITSGRGSREAAIVDPYVSAVREFVATLGDPPDVVDLGCGDFNVGARVRDTCGAYVACDVAPIVIERNRERFADLSVDFRVLDMIEEPLPAGDVVFIRQVLQHLSNAQIGTILPKLAQYDWAVITEHVPGDPDFVPNRDISPGPAIRTAVRSGVVLEAPPFSLRPSEARALCVVQHPEGTIATTAYRFA
ncbi:methyltransferase [Paraconexibacter sp. AEG42_29]|uniref:Methyltransferase n=2 Tax=Paraconexibacter sp. AEG42_29 TaxID=2997339 RepID=A0AAU7AX23_9ACTN